MLWFRKKQQWPDMPFEEIKKRARLLVIDDDPFAYLEIFQKNGYAIEQWTDVEDLNRLESGAFDLILLDVQGVGKKISPTEQGLGVLRHLRVKSPAQLVVAFSSADYSLKYQDFFALADRTLTKSADYVDFQRVVDELLHERFSLGFYVDRIAQTAEAGKVEPSKLKREAEEAIVSRDPGKLSKFMKEKMFTKENIELVGSLVRIAIEVADKWRK